MTTQAQARQLLFSLLPPGELYDLDNSTSDVYKFFNAFAQTVKTYGFDILDMLETEFNVSAATQKLPDWEAALGLTQCPGVSGSLTERRQAIISRLREFGSIGIGSIPPVIAPLFGSYTNLGLVDFIEVDRAGFGARHTHTSGTALVITTPAGWHFHVPDAGYTAISSLTFTIDTGASSISDANDFKIQITSPSGSTKIYFLNSALGGTVSQAAGIQTSRVISLKTNEIAGPARGIWSVRMEKITGVGPGFTVSDVSLFVEGAASTGDSAEGLQRLPGLGTGAYEWAVAPFGATNPIDAHCVQLTLDRIKPAHTKASYIYSAARTFPDEARAVPGRFIPGLAVDASAYTTAVWLNSPTAYWRMSAHDDFGTETNLGSSGAGLALTYSGYTTRRVTRGALYRDPDRASIIGLASASSYATAGAAYVNGIRVFSLEAWARTNITRNGTAGEDVPECPIFGHRASVQSSFGLSGGIATVWLKIGGVSTGYTTATSIADDRWHHIVWTVNGVAGGSIVQYVDGVATNTIAVGGTDIDLVTLQDIGSAATNLAGFNFFDGALDEVAVYTTVLNSADINAHFAAGRNIA